MKMHTFARAASFGALIFSLGAAGCGDDPAAPELNLVETAIAAGDFTTLVAAAQAAGLDQTLATGGPFTIFAPTDAAFEALPAGTLDALLQDPDALADILLYHVISGEVLAADAVNLTSATTLLGESVTIDATNGVQINGANVIQTDVIASNGVIHVIDQVLIPQGN